MLPTESSHNPDKEANNQTAQLGGVSSSKRRLLDFSSTTLQPITFTNEWDAELEGFFAQPMIDIKPSKFWLGRKESTLRNLALQLL